MRLYDSVDCIYNWMVSYPIKMKKLITRSLFAFLALLIPLSAHAADSPPLTLISPNERQVYHPGDFIELNWGSQAISTPVTVNLTERSLWKRIRIDYVYPQANSTSEITRWQIPEDFFSLKKLSPTAHYFKVEIKTHNGNKWIRSISRTSLIKIEPNGTDSSVQSSLPDISNTVKTTVTIPQEPEVTLPAKAELIARYEFSARLEPWVVKRLRVVNDTENDGFDPDPNETTDVVKAVYLSFKNEAGQQRVHQAGFVSGGALFSNLDFYIPRAGSAFVELWAEPVDINQSTNTYSGSRFRVGIQDTGNTTATFEALAQISSTTDHSLSSLQFNSGSIQEFVVRQNIPVFSINGTDRRALYNGEETFYEFTIDANSARFGRLVFDISQNGLDSLNQVSVVRNSTFLTPGDTSSTGKVYLMWDAGGESCFAHTPQNGPGTGMDCNGNTAASSKLILAFSQEEIVSGRNTYKLRFNVSGVDVDDRVTVRLVSEDDFAKPVLPGTSSLNGEIYNGGGAELFSGVSDFISEASAITDRNIIWSDRSADTHLYPSITAGNPPTTGADGSADWTNGYLLKLNTLPAVTWIRD